MTQIQAPPPQQQAPPPKTRRKPPAKKAPTLADIMNRFTQIGAVSFETTEQNNEFVSILMTLQVNLFLKTFIILILKLFREIQMPRPRKE